ncbi:MAG TPA: branched-chain amino acid aminotransferase, partial [Verrucomicrobiales bacterium]|nr:branched-chain amino acid aminotransferase [Verrucomicrobiales bacterium]
MPESGRQDAQSINKSKTMSRNIWLDGKIVDESDAKISVFDHGLLYGDGIFEGIRFYNGRVFRLTEHIERLYLSAKALLLKMPWTLEEVCEATLQTIRANNLNDGYIRLVVTRGIGDLGLNPYLCPNPSMFIIASGITLYPAELYENGLEVVTCSTRRPTPASLSPQVKSLNYLNNVMA